ncbi:MAG: hypothetical protein EAZ57_01835 [Cytophagales bacterium]|nr:MAG: hypothetical protein EAZ67_02755 [Cytophagales bacterium]TAF61864.1 MAG: hypothetical protein EAZ57_01835 [Cytophagales bacterium]
MPSSNDTGKPIVSSSRTSINVTLTCTFGTVPNDMYGYAFMNTPSGTVNSALPYPKYNSDGTLNQEYGSSSLGGDAYIMRFDMTTPGQVKLKASILQPYPTFQADYAHRWGTKDHLLFGFFNFGIARLSIGLGGREQAATAFLPVMFDGDENYRMYATSDMGRAFEFNTTTLQCLSPLGKFSDYVPANPPELFWWFPVIQTTAHPMFDPNSKLLYTLNYKKGGTNEFSHILSFLANFKGKNFLSDAAEVLESKIKDIQNKKLPKEGQANELLDFLFDYGKGDLHLSLPFLERRQKREEASQPLVRLLTYDGKNPLQSWNITDANGNNISIQQCTHQMGITQNYILFSDSAFKTTLDVLSPFAFNAVIDNFIRTHASAPQEPFTNLYVIKKADLVAGVTDVKAMTFQLRPEFIHFVCEYDDANGTAITLYSANNSAACLAEWIRFYDTLVDGSAADPSSAGILATGAMDVSRLGKAVLNIPAQTYTDDFLALTGSETTPDGPHTWVAGFYSYRGMLSPFRPINKIKYLFYQCSGLENRRLSQFIYNLYKDYPNRIVPVEEVVSYTEAGVPFQVSRFNTQTMQIEDYYSFPKASEIMSLHFVPRKRPSSYPIVDSQMDGYVFCAVITQAGASFNREIWIFDAANLKAGPCCILTHPQLDFSTTLHWVWMENAPTQKTSFMAHKMEALQMLKDSFQNIEDEIPSVLKNILHRTKKR